MSDVDDVAVIKSSRRRTVQGTFSAAAFVAVGVILIGQGGVVGIVVGALTVVLFGGGLLILLWPLVSPLTLLTINTEGIRTGGLFGPKRPIIPWEEIAGVRVYRFHAAALSSGIRMLGFVPRHPEAPIWTSGRLKRMNTSMTGLPVSISDRNLSIELEELTELMRRFRPNLPVEYGEPRAAGLGKLGAPKRGDR